MESYLENLNENQHLAVTTSSVYVRIIAGAGSGKTRVLTTRIAYLIDKFQVEANRIVAITFTNKAANEMKKRVEKMLESCDGKPHISTIHSFCVTILRQDITYLKYPRNFTIIDNDDQKTILKEAYKKYDIDVKALSYGTVLDYIANNKGAGIDYQRAKDRAGNFGNEKLKALIYEYYVQRQTELFALDFDDLLLFTLALFQKNEKVLKKWQRKFSVVLVDEFQDIDHVQYDIIKLLVGTDNALYVVGDPDQTIYTWRGADVNIIMNLEKVYPKLETITLTTNYRSSASILNAANNLIANNKYRYPKDLVAVSKEIHDIVYYGAIDEENESLWIAGTIKDLVIRKKIKHEEIAVLYRANYLSRSVEKALVNMQIPYIIYGGISFYNRQEIKDVLCYLRLLISEDDLALKRIINVPRRKVGSKTLDSIEIKAREENKTMFAIIKQYPDNFSGQVGKNIRDFVALITAMQQQLDSSDLLSIAEQIISRSGYKDMLSESNEFERLENVKELLNDIADFSQSFPQSGLDEYLQIISLYTDREVNAQEDAVKLMTIHAAKGLEYEVVFVCGMNEGVFPSDRTLEEGIKGLEEERRLAYVAYTRAKKHLYLSDSKGHSYVLGKVKTTSRFVEEIGLEHLKMLGNIDYAYYNRAVEEGRVIKQEAKFNGPSTNWKVNDKVEHEVFHKGVVVKVQDGYIEIAFSFPHGIKKIIKDFPGMRKI